MNESRRSAIAGAGRGQHRRPARDLNVDRNRASDLQPANCETAADRARDRELTRLQFDGDLVGCEVCLEDLRCRRVSTPPVTGAPMVAYEILPPQLATAEPRQRPPPPLMAPLPPAEPVSEPRLKVVLGVASIRVAIGGGSEGSVGSVTAKDTPVSAGRESRFRVEVGESPVPGEVEIATQEVQIARVGGVRQRAVQGCPDPLRATEQRPEMDVPRVGDFGRATRDAEKFPRACSAPA